MSRNIINGLQEQDMGTPPFCSLPRTTEVIWQSVYCFASLCPGILFHFTAVIGSIQWLQTNEVDLLTLRIRQSSELNRNPEDRVIDLNVRELIYPKCLLCCDVARELTLYLCEILKHIFICIYSHFLLTICAP